MRTLITHSPEAGVSCLIISAQHLFVIVLESMILDRGKAVDQFYNQFRGYYREAQKVYAAHFSVPYMNV